MRLIWSLRCSLWLSHDNITIAYNATSFHSISIIKHKSVLAAQSEGLSSCATKDDNLAMPNTDGVLYMRYPWGSRPRQQLRSSIQTQLTLFMQTQHGSSPAKAFTHASSVNTLWWQKLSLWLSQHGFEGVLAEGTLSLANAEQHLRDKWYHGICQSSATKVSFFMDNMFFDSNLMASYLRDIRPSASLFSLIKFRSYYK